MIQPHPRTRRSSRRHDGREGGVSDNISLTDPTPSRPSCLRRLLQDPNVPESEFGP